MPSLCARQWGRSQRTGRYPRDRCDQGAAPPRRAARHGELDGIRENGIRENAMPSLCARQWGRSQRTGRCPRGRCDRVIGTARAGCHFRCVDAGPAGAEPSGAKKTTRSGELNREPKKQCGLFGLRESGGKRKEREMRRRIDVSSRCHHIVFGHTGTTSTA